MNKLLLVLLAFVLCSCGYPGRGLNTLEKQADIAWVYGVFSRNYAPADWKKKEFGFSLEQAQQDCLGGATMTDGGEFIAHLNRCVNRFKDAHTRILAGGTVLPEFAKVAYLGFRTAVTRIDLAHPPVSKDKEKNGDSNKDTNPAALTTVLKVKQLLPTTTSEDFPVKEDDFIVKINGQPVADYLAAELTSYSDLGNSNSSMTVAAEIFPVRTSHENHLPVESSIRLDVLRDELTFKVEVPWTVKDLLEFQNEQALAAQTKKPKEEKEKKADAEPAESMHRLRWDGDELITSFWAMFNEFRNSSGARVSILLQNTFRVYNFNPTMKFLESLETKKETETKLPVELAISVPSLKVENEKFPSRVFLLEDGTRIGYVRVESFDLKDSDVKSFASLNEEFTKMKVKGVILDLLNNGGGSLVHGLRMANLLTTRDLQFPKMQLALNDNWMNGFHADSMYLPNGKGSDARRTLSKRVYQMLQEDIHAGLRISRPISTAELDPFVLSDSKVECAKTGKCLGERVKLVLLVNEMCASMCDIFAATFRDNKLGTIVGSQTMGAGGNVTMHASSPITNIVLRQTESLVLDSNNNYLENQGVKPDEAIDTLADSVVKFEKTYKKALALVK